jgi:alpha-beta hydrolase superfamily lysophospholipase
MGRDGKEQRMSADLDAWLAEKERAVPGVIPGDEKTIAWAGKKGVKTPVSLIYLHGWQGSPHDYGAVLVRMASALGANVYYARLSGFCVANESVVKITLDDLLDDAREALEIGRRIGGRVVVVGSSMGGDLALWLGAQNLPDIASLVLFSPAVQPLDKRSEMLLWPWPLPNIILRAVIGKYNPMTYNLERYPTGDPALFARLNPPRYRSESTLKLMAVVRLTRTLALEKMTTPSVWLYTDKDDAVDIPTLRKFYERAGSRPKKLVFVTGAYSHMLAGDMFSPDTTAEVADAALGFLSDMGVR